MRTPDNSPRQPVASGEYMISGRKNGIINAYLGTCVGVAIWDRKAGVGGLIHLLLPEPTCRGGYGKPESYAVTGLPIFLSALCKAGARMEGLEATIAGGALVGPLSEMDLNLDIGGRTLEIVEEILFQNNIPILKSETGGFFSCQLSLDLKTWESHIEPISVLTTVEDEDFDRPGEDQIEEGMQNVCSIPQIVLKLIRMLRDETLSLEDIAKEIRRDQVTAAKVMRFCNSAFFYRKLNVDSIDRALVMLGEKQLLKLTISAIFKDFYSQRSRGYSLCKGGLFNHAIGTALLSEQLAILTGKAASDIAYTAGLLHDIGKVVLDQYMCKAYPFFYRRTQLANESLFTVEQEVFGISHDDIGGKLAERWSLTDDLINVIKNHHHPERASMGSELTHIIYLADLLMSRFFVGQEIERLSDEHLDSRLQKIGLSVDQFPVIVDNIPRQIFSLPFSTAKQKQFS